MFPPSLAAVQQVSARALLTMTAPAAKALLYQRFRKVQLPAAPRRTFNSSPPPVHPFFQKKPEAAAAEDSGPFKWLPSLGPAASCLHAIYLDPPSRPKVAAFDLDGTVITGKGDRQWWSPVVPKKIREAHEEGSVVYCPLRRVLTKMTGFLSSLSLIRTSNLSVSRTGEQKSKGFLEMSVPRSV